MTWAWIVAAILRALAPGAVAGLRSTALRDLTAQSSSENLAAASIAGLERGVDPALLLSIAWHESRYRASEVTLEAGAKTSCGVMTPEPMARCRPGSPLR